MTYDHLAGKPWYRPDLSRQAAESMLMASPMGTFVIRPSSTPDCLALSQKSDEGDIFHARILCIRRQNAYVGYSIGGDSEVFPTVDALLKRVQPKTKFVVPTTPPAQQAGFGAQPAGFGARPGPAPGAGGFGQPSPTMMQGGFRGAPAPAAAMTGQSQRGGPGMGPGRAGPAGQWGAPAVSPSGFDIKSPLSASTQIEMSELVFEKELGAGSFGQVYKGQWRKWTVAIKQLKNQVPQDSKEYKEFIGEAELMTRIRPHENVVRFVGVTRPPNLCIVLEFVERGALYDFLQKPDPISGEVMLNIIRGICKGMAHLHEEKVVHRDLAARNVMLDRNLNAKIADFGMSRNVSQEKNQTKSDTGPLKWMAPESIRNREYSRKSDVWAFSVVITEILTRCGEPYPDLEPIQVATRVAYEDLRPPIPKDASATMVSVLQSCSERNPKDRPEFTQIIEWIMYEQSVFA